MKWKQPSGIGKESSRSQKIYLKIVSFLLTIVQTPLTSSHSSLSFAPPHPIFSHAPFSLFQYAPFLHISLFLYSNTSHSPSFPIPSHVFFSSKSNHVHSPKMPLLQNPKPENPFVLSQCSTPFAELSSSFPLQKINAHPASPKTPFFKIFAYPIFPLNFLNSLFLPIPFFPTKTKKG